MGTRMLSLLVAAFALTVAAQQQYTFTLYDGQSSDLAFTLQSWSFGRVNLKNAQPAAPGDQYSVSLGCGYDTALALHGSLVFPFSSMQSLQFSVNGGPTGNQDVTLSLYDPQAQIGRTVSLKNDLGVQIKANQWVAVTVPFAKFQNGTKPQPGDLLYGLHVSAPPTSQSQDTVFISSIRAAVVAPSAQHVSVSVAKAAPNAPEVSPLIFGVNFGSVAQITKNQYKVNRWGGNAVTRYAWDLDVNNHAADWFFEDIANNVDEKLLPFNTSSDAFVRDSVASGSVPVLTLPTIGWAPFDRTRRCGFSVAKYGPQQRADQFDSDCGNGVKQDGSFVTGNLPTDTSRAVGPSYALDWLAHLEAAFGAATVNSMLYILDNEPNYWDSTHRDVHPKPITYDELWNYTVAYASAIKAKYPSLTLMGPDISGYCHLFFSPADGFCKDGSDRKAHGDLPLMQWFIQQLGAYAQKNNGVHLLDYLDIHCYPDAPMGKSGDMATTVLLLRSTRELWDPTYTAETWYMQPTYYLRQIRQYIGQYAPWLKVSCTEYNYGFDDADVSGAVANVEVFGIYAREGVSLATRWVAPQNASKAEKAFKLALNYDGKGGHLSGKVLDTESSDPANVAVYAFDDGKTLQVLLICKQPGGSVPVALDLSATGATAGTADIYRLDASHDGEKIGTATISGGTATVVVTGVSATLLVLQH